jgi:hypothetical protein
VEAGSATYKSKGRFSGNLSDGELEGQVFAGGEVTASLRR